MSAATTVRGERSNRLALIAGLLAMVLILVGGIFASDQFARTLERSTGDAQSQRLKERGLAEAAAVAASLQVIETAMLSLKDYAGSSAIDAPTFDAMAKAILTRHPAVLAIGLAEVGSASASAASSVMELDWLGNFVAASPRASYLPVTAMLGRGASEGIDFSAWLNFDLLSNPDWAALLRADGGAIRVSYKALAPSDALLLIPIGSDGSLSKALMAEIDLSALLVARSGGATDTGTRIYDVTDRSGIKLLFPAAANPLDRAEGSADSLHLSKRRMAEVASFEVLGRQWQVDTEPLTSFFAQIASRTPLFVRYGGAGFSILGALLLLSLITRNARVERLVQKRGDELKSAYERVRDSEMMSMQNEKMSSLGQMVAGVAHEINTPLGFVSSNVELLQERMTRVSGTIEQQQTLLTELRRWSEFGPAERNGWYYSALDSLGALETMSKKRTLSDTQALLGETREGLDRVADLVSTLKDFSRVDRAAVDSVDVHACIESTLKIANNLIKHKANVVRDYGRIPTITCMPSQINQVLLNIISNAAQAIPAFGEIRITTSQVADCVVIAIADNGSGMPAEVRSKIFEPFFSTKGVGKGTGLGLAICERIVLAHQGKIEVDSKVGQGTTFTIALPIKSTIDQAAAA